ncbi:hypothetical protein KAF25_008700, partial [Fusarium avenaceum]
TGNAGRMDPLSITTACVGLLATVTKTALAVTNFTRDCREARSDLTSITGELSQLNLVLELLRDETAVTDDRIMPESLQIHILSTINSCSSAVSKINTILDKHTGKTGMLRWATFGKNEVAGLRTSLEAYRGSLSLVLELVSVSLSKAIRNDTTAIRTDVYDIKQDTSQISQIMDELVRLRAIVASGGIPSASSGQNFILQQYLDGLTSYAESVCNDVVWETDSSVRAGSRASSRASLRIASSVPVLQVDRNIDASSQDATISDIVYENEEGVAILEPTRSATADGESSMSEDSKSPEEHYPRSLRNRDNSSTTPSGSHIQILQSKPSISTPHLDKLPDGESHISSQGETGCELPEIKPILATPQLEKLLIDMNTFSSQASYNNESKTAPQITNFPQQSDRLSTEDDSEDVLVSNDRASLGPQRNCVTPTDEGTGTSQTTPQVKKKMVIVGDTYCGKTALYMFFLYGTFTLYARPTMFDNYAADIEIDGKTVELALWDTAGNENCDRLRPLSYPDTDIIMICFNIDSLDSLDNVIEKWIHEVKHFLPNVPRLFVGLKKDLRDDPETVADLNKISQRPVSWEEARAFGYFECSAKTGEGVNEVFEAVVRQTLVETKKVPKGLRNLFKRLSSSFWNNPSQKTSQFLLLPVAAQKPMVNPNKSGKATSGTSVARDFNNALQGTLAFEAMRFTANYARIAQAELRTCDYDELMSGVDKAAKLLPDSFDPNSEEWPEDAEEVNQRMEELLKDCDKLAGGFKKFVENARAAGMAVKRQQ